MTLNAKKINPIFSESELSLLQAFNEKQLELTESFVENIDKHIGYYTKEQFYQTHADDEGEMIEVEVPHINGISENEFNIEGLFSKSLPMYQRQSMLVTNWAIFENELTECYSHLASTQGKSSTLPKKIKIKDKLSGDKRNESDLERLIRGFEELDLFKNKSTYLNKAIELLVYEVRIIRNDWVHNGGVPRRIKVNEVEGVELNGSQIDISADYLRKVVEWMLIFRSELYFSTVELLRSKKDL